MLSKTLVFSIIAEAGINKLLPLIATIIIVALSAEGAVFQPSSSWEANSVDEYYSDSSKGLFSRVILGVAVEDESSSVGVCWVDVNDDGLLDLYIANMIYPQGECDEYYIYGDGDPYAKIMGVPMVEDVAPSYAACWGDFDNDFDLDLVVANWRTSPSVLYINNGNGDFTPSMNGPMGEGAVGATSASWIDYDLDGDVDLFITNSTGPMAEDYPPHPNWLFRNDSGTLVRVTTGIMGTHSRHTYGVAWSDYDNDGDPDVVMSNNLDEPIDLMTNNGNGDFTLEPTSVLGTNVSNSGGCSWGDYDNDGDQDLFVACTRNGSCLLFRNENGSGFTKIQNHGLAGADSTALAGVWGDYDNDGDLDVFVWSCEFMNPAGSKGYLFENRADGTFDRVTDDEFLCDSCTADAAVWADYNRDGYLDLYLARLDPQFLSRPDYLKNRLYINNAGSNNWIIIKPIGAVSNRFGVGTKVKLKANIDGVPVWQLRELMTITGLRAQPPHELHFGLKNALIVDTILIEWLDGTVQVQSDVAVNQCLEIYRENQYLCGDASADGRINLLDILYLIAYKYNVPPGPEPAIMEAGDVNSDDTINLLDILFLIDFIYGTPPGPEPDCD